MTFIRTLKRSKIASCVPSTFLTQLMSNHCDLKIDWQSQVVSMCHKLLAAGANFSLGPHCWHRSGEDEISLEHYRMIMCRVPELAEGKTQSLFKHNLGY